MSIQEKASCPSNSVPCIRGRGRQQPLIETIDRIAHRLRNVLVTVEVWCETARQRRALARLDDRMLNDIGLSRDQIFRELERPFWDV